MTITFEERMAEVLAFLVVLGLVSLVLWLMVRTLWRSRAGLAIGWPVGVALAMRVLVAAGVSLTSLGQSLRGGDELSFLFQADRLLDTSFASEPWSDALTHELHVFVLAFQGLVLDAPEMALRATEAGLAVAGLALLAAAVYDLAGARSALIAAWILALEPASVFFGTLLHKESLMMLAIGLVALGSARIWRQTNFTGLVPIAAGCAVAAATRGYVSWFLIAAAAAITLHAGLRNARERTARSLVAVSSVVLLAALVLPFVFGGFADENLSRLQVSQSANARDESNLQLEEVDFSSGTAIVTDLPQRLFEVVFRPYIWELDNASQQLGLMGSLVVLVGLYWLIRELLRNRGRIMSRAGPFLYLGTSLLIAYALAAGNAGTAFRYRVQVVALGICAVSALAVRVRARDAAAPSQTTDIARAGVAA